MNKPNFINLERINIIREITSEGEPSLLNELIELFERDSVETIQNLGVAIQNRDFLKIVQFSHKLKGSCANLGIDPLKDLCQTIENLGREKKLDDIPSNFTRVQELYPEALAKLISLKS